MSPPGTCMPPIRHDKKNLPPADAPPPSLVDAARSFRSLTVQQLREDGELVRGLRALRRQVESDRPATVSL